MARSSLALLGAVIWASSMPGCVSMSPSVVNPDAYLGQRTSPAGIYQPGSAALLLPVLDVRIDAMDRLFLVDFAGDPVYDGLELQTFPGAGGQPDVRILLWRPDTVDVYDRPGRSYDEAADRRAMEPLLSPRAVTFQRAEFEHRFRIGEHGLDAAVRIRDREGREVVVEVVETRGDPVIGALIAPLGSSSAAPDYLPVFFLDDFALVKRKGTHVRISVDGQARRPARMPRLMKGPAAYFTRYSDRVVIASWNERRDAVLDPVAVPPGAASLEAGGIEWRIHWNGERAEVEGVVARSGDDALIFRFAPALPDLAALRPGARVDGRFVVDVNAVPGVLAGEYSVERSDAAARLVFQPLRAWQPPMMRGPAWVSTYRYEAEVDLTEADAPRLRGHWSRPGRAPARPRAGAAVEGRRHTVVPMPVMFYMPETRWGYGAAAFHSWRLWPEGRPTLTGGHLILTQNRQLTAELATTSYLAEDRYVVALDLGRTVFPERFYGIGNDTRAGDEELYTARSTRVNVDVRRRAGHGLYLGGSYFHRGFGISDLDPEGRLAGGAVTGAGGGRVSGAGLVAALDTRDNLFSPATGQFHTLAVSRAGDPLGGDFRFTRYTADLRRYVHVRDGQTLAVQALGRSVTGDVPFDMLPVLGGPQVMRGTFQGRYRDHHLVAAQVEYRALVWWRVGAAAFVGAGQVADRLDRLALNDLQPSWGYGLRFALDPRERLNVRFDIGHGQEGVRGIYIALGEAF